jgi:hypothetical protein
LIPTLTAGAPFPFKIVLGIDDALLPAAVAGTVARQVEKIAIVAKRVKRLGFTCDLPVVGMSPV